jgi:hypothetical protein
MYLHTHCTIAERLPGSTESQVSNIQMDIQPDNHNPLSGIYTLSSSGKTIDKELALHTGSPLSRLLLPFRKCRKYSRKVAYSNSCNNLPPRPIHRK